MFSSLQWQPCGSTPLRDTLAMPKADWAPRRSVLCVDVVLQAPVADSVAAARRAVQRTTLLAAGGRRPWICCLLGLSSHSTALETLETLPLPVQQERPLTGNRRAL